MWLAANPPAATRLRVNPAPSPQLRVVTPELPPFEVLYERHYAFVARTVRRLGVAEEAVEDVCQEVFVVIYRRLSEFEGRSKLETWIYRIVANAVRNQARTQRRKAPHSRSAAGAVDPEILEATEPGPEANLGRTRAAELARNILMSMSEPKRMAFVLVELEGMSYAEAATALAETFDTVRARVRAARVEFSRQARRLQNLSGGV